MLSKLNSTFLQGEILTIADASFADKEQRKAVKDLIRHQFKRRIQYMQDLCMDATACASTTPYANNAG